ncbi:MAG: apolipoprotein N-acyltransferase [Nitrospirales bacterium]|nr:apolipoprotein N-acyltransferase [Nitrospirales bacterium]
MKSSRLWEHPLARVLLALLSAVLLICSLPAPDIGWLGWISLVPIMIACQGLNPLRAGGLGLIFGIASSFGIYGWLFEVPSFDMRHAILLALYVGSYPATWCATTAWLTPRHAPLLLTAPILWVAIDYLRAHAGFLALPWGTLAQTQHHNLPILQIASLAGEQAVTFLVVLGNAALVSLILRGAQQGALAVGVILTLAHLWGASVLSSEQPGRMIRLAAIQPNILIDERKTEAGRRENMERLEQLTHAAAADRPTLIVWPESAIPGNLQADPVLIGRLQGLSDTIGIPLILGAAEVEKFATGDREIMMNRRVFNTAHLLRPGQPLALPYRKRMLVPFAEYLPHPDIIPWPEWLAPRVSEMTPGERAQLFNMTTDLSIGALICWENVFAPLARESVRNGAHLLVQLTNDVWFGQSAAPWQHNLMSVMRAVENRVPIVIASNTGPSQIIDGYGRVIASAQDIFIKGLATGRVHTGVNGTVYTAVGDFFVLSGMALFSLYVTWRIVKGPLPVQQRIVLNPRRGLDY